jgi:SAM-dependent methyltransferase
VALTGREHFYDEWRALVSRTVSAGPVVDLGNSHPFAKDLRFLRDTAPRPWYALDVAPARRVAVVADGHRLPLRDRSVGSVVCSHVLEHVDRPEMVIDEIHRVLRPGGGAYLTFLDTHPYHAAPGRYRDLHRFKRDAIDLLLHDWDSIEVVAGGGACQAALNYAPTRLRPALQLLANVVDPRWRTTVTPVFYVGARRSG